MGEGNGAVAIPHITLRILPSGELQFQTNITDPAQVNFILDQAKGFVLAAATAPKTRVQPVAMMPTTGFSPKKGN